MKINFFTLNPDENVGSYRIWVRDLSRSINDIGHTSTIIAGNSGISEISDSDVIILGKSAFENAKGIKSITSNTSIKIGAINMPRDYRDSSIDFAIVGSPEEMCSLAIYDNVFIYPLIEREFENVSPRSHINGDSFRICFHGHYPHLSKFEPFLKQAIENISKDINIDLVIITGNSEIDWQIGKPANVNVEMHKYNLKTVSEIIKSCDVGVVPNVSDIRTYVPGISKIVSKDLGLYDTDYFLRFKNKTNGGRAYVFYQHGIPVIHDISPSSFEFMSKVGEYICAHDSTSWEKNLRKMLNKDYRNKVSQMNYNQFNISYNPLDHARKLVEFIGGI